VVVAATIPKRTKRFNVYFSRDRDIMEQAIDEAAQTWTTVVRWRSGYVGRAGNMDSFSTKMIH